ncbi:hypothetical protein K474DRAFT_1705765 [Panus rudis PR-1116 ss-1]|nr:hypothetical protein K474DRAFT_1705765 [Panus rudis PR-1116 ss-1]
MSAYGAISRAGRPTSPLPTTVWHLNPKAAGSPTYVTLHHLTLSTARERLGLIPYLHTSFAEELERGMTYPQEILQGELYTRDMFETYWLAADALVAIIGNDNTFVEGKADGSVVDISIDDAMNGRTWADCIAGTYYVKPNYPGRSSHICNAGFLIPTAQRGRGFGAALARSYLYYGPRLGYEASVFNLVYVNNVASVKLWEALNFTKIGRLPRAGRLKKADGEGEEYVDAWIFYKQFDKSENGTL